MKLFSRSLWLFLLFHSTLCANEARTPYGAGWGALGAPSAALPGRDSFAVNPSHAAFLDQRSVTLSGQASADGRGTFQSFGILPFGRFGTAWGASRTSVSGISLRDNLNNDTGEAQFYMQKGTFAAAFRLDEPFAVGAAVNVFSSGLGGERFSSGKSFDFGISGALSRLLFGASFLAGEDKGEREVRLGFGRNGALSGAGEIIFPLQKAPYPVFSFGWRPHPALEARLSLNLNRDNFRESGLISALAFGFEFTRAPVAIEYLPLFNRDFGWSHAFAFTYSGRKRDADPRRKAAARPLPAALPVLPARPAGTFGGMKPASVASRGKAEAGETASWSQFVSDAQSYFSVLSREVEAGSEGNALVLNLKNVRCLGRGRFSVQSGAVLVQTAKFLKKRADAALSVQVQGAEDEAFCAESVADFLYNEGISRERLKRDFALGAPAVKILAAQSQDVP